MKIVGLQRQYQAQRRLWVGCLKKGPSGYLRLMGTFPEGQTTLSAEGMGSYCFHLGFKAFVFMPSHLRHISYFLHSLASQQIGVFRATECEPYSSFLKRSLSYIHSLLVEGLGWQYQKWLWLQTEFKCWLVFVVSMTLSNLFSYSWLIPLSY